MREAKPNQALKDWRSGAAMRLPAANPYLNSSFLKGLSYEIDFENVDENWQILALTRAAVGF